MWEKKVKPDIIAPKLQCTWSKLPMKYLVQGEEKKSAFKRDREQEY